MSEILTEFGVATMDDLIRLLFRRLSAQDDIIQGLIVAVGTAFESMTQQVVDSIANTLGDAMAAAIEGIPFVGPLLAVAVKTGTRVIFRSAFKFSYTGYGGYNIS